MSFRLIFSDESLFYGSFDPGSLELPASEQELNDKLNTSTVALGNQTIKDPNPSVDQSSIDVLTNQIAVQSEAKIEIVIADEKNDPNPQKVEVPVSKETANSLEAVIVSVQDNPVKTEPSVVETKQPEPMQNPTVPINYIPQYTISNSSFTFIRGTEKTSESITYSFNKLLDQNFNFNELKDKKESSLLSRFIDFAKSVIKVVQPRFEYEYGAEDIRKDKADKTAQQKANQKIQEKLDTHKPSQEEVKRKENNKSMRKNEIAESDRKQNNKSQQYLQKVKINEEILKSLLKK